MRQYLTEHLTLNAADFGSVDEAYEHVRDKIDLAGYTVTINTDTCQAALVGEPTGSGMIVIRGMNGHPGQTKCSFYVGEGAKVLLDNMTLCDDGRWDAFGDGVAVSRGIVYLSNIWIGQCTVGVHACGSQSLIRGVGPITTLHGTISRIQFNAENGANIELPCPLIISGGPQWDVYAQADGGSVIDFAGCVITKAAERGKYSAAMYDGGFVRLGPGMNWSSLPGNGEVDSDRYVE